MVITWVLSEHCSHKVGIFSGYLRFHTYLDALRSIKVPHQLKRKFEQRNKNLHFVMKRYKSLNSFDVSNFTKNCEIHNVPFSTKNLSNYVCQDQFCRHTKIPVLRILSEKLDDLFVKKFYFLDEQLCTIWFVATCYASINFLITTLCCVLCCDGGWWYWCAHIGGKGDRRRWWLIIDGGWRIIWHHPAL